jgi:hypothetical protein
MKRPGIASTVWFLAFVAVSILLFRQVFPSNERRDDDIMFAPKNFADSGQWGFEGSVGISGISGTLTGDNLGNKNNTTVVYCEKTQRMHNVLSRTDWSQPHWPSRLFSHLSHNKMECIRGGRRRRRRSRSLALSKNDHHPPTQNSNGSVGRRTDQSSCRRVQRCFDENL